MNISSDTLKIGQIEGKHDNSDFDTIVIKVPTDTQYDYDMDIGFCEVKMYAMGKEIWINSGFTDIELFAPTEKLDVVSSFGNVKVTADSSSSIFTFNSGFGNVYISLLDTVGYTVQRGSVKDEYNDRSSSKTSSYDDDTLSINVDIGFGRARLTDWQ